MLNSQNPSNRLGLTAPFLLLIIFLTILWMAGGASRPDAIGQTVTRVCAWLTAIVFILYGPRPELRRVAPIALLLTGAILLAVVQLIPLPPAIWMELPARDLLAQAAIVSGQDQPWRPLSISPQATANALSSLIVPTVTLLYMATLNVAKRQSVAGLLLLFIIASSLLGLFQFSGFRFDNPLINDVRGDIGGSFANRNHFALFVAIGCILAPAWAFQHNRHSRKKGGVAFGLIIFFSLMLLAIGSRMGLLLGLLGIGIGLLIANQEIRKIIGSMSKKWSISLSLGAICLATATVLASVNLGRAVSINRIIELSTDADLRLRSFPTVLEMVKKYFPAGTGLGTFDPAYRIEEQDALLSVFYFNHAHNDLLEVILDGGILGLLLLSASIIWWFWQSVKIWGADKGSHQMLSKAGSGILFLVLIASAFDYPARTPMIAAIIIIAATWLSLASHNRVEDKRQRKVSSVSN